MFTGMELMECRSLAVPTEVIQHVIHVESSDNPYAIGVVGGRLVRQPRNLPEALATVRMLEASGYNYSLGAAQINRNNLRKYGLDSYEQAFDPCPNMTAGSKILAACYASSGGDWGKAFSCYYSGNFVSGYRDGYVQKIYDSIQQNSDPNRASATVIPLQALPNPWSKGSRNSLRTASANASYRVALRSEIVDNGVSLMASKLASTLVRNATAPAPIPATSGDRASGAASLSETDTAPTTSSPTETSASTSSVFVPTVRGPNDPAAQATPVAQASTAPSKAAPSILGDRADLRQGSNDAAFVF